MCDSSSGIPLQLISVKSQDRCNWENSRIRVPFSVILPAREESKPHPQNGFHQNLRLMSPAQFASPKTKPGTGCPTSEHPRFDLRQIFPSDLARLFFRTVRHLA
jgi:hypothetical protein